MSASCSVALLNYETEKANRSKLIRWCIRLQQFDFTAHYITGIENAVADFLSRDVLSKDSKVIEGGVFVLQTVSGLRILTVKLCGAKEHYIFNLDAIIDRSVRVWEEKQRQKAIVAPKSLSRGDKHFKHQSGKQRPIQRESAPKALSRRAKQLNDSSDVETVESDSDDGCFAESLEVDRDTRFRQNQSGSAY